MNRALYGAGLALILIMAPGCVTTETAGVEDFQHHVRSGMSEAQVREVLGQPRRVTIPWQNKLQGWMRVVEFDLNYANDEPGCPENEIGKALLNFVTLGMGEMARRAASRYRYRLYFYQGRFVAGCRVAKKPPVGRFCQKLETDLIRLGYAGWSRPQVSARPRTFQPAVWRRHPATGPSIGHTGPSPRLRTGASGYYPGLGKQPAPAPRLGPSVPPPPPGSVRPRW